MIPRQLVLATAVLLMAATGISIYAWRMRKGEMRLEPQASAPIAPPPSGPTERVTLYVAYDDPGVLLPQTTIIPLPGGRQQRAEELLRALLQVYQDKSSPHPLGPGSEVRSVYMVDPGLAVLDLNSAFADGHRSGILVEELSMASLVQTLASNIPGITRVKVLVDGKERETLAGHADLTRFYDVSSVEELMQQMRGAH
ncbi:MAG TPA: GerMN domain-containing protein [Terriglobales bacterium]|jgi:spore germination protein GerM